MAAAKPFSTEGINSRGIEPPEISFTNCKPVLPSSFGDIITVAPNSLSFLPCKQGSYNQMTIEFKDQDYNNVKLQDNQMVMMLVLRTRNDIELETIKE
jgi:hypothetical protein